MRVVTADETINTECVLLAIGLEEQPYWPRWAIRHREKRVGVNHLFDPKFSLDELRTDIPVTVIGAGISGGHIALRALDR